MARRRNSKNDTTKYVIIGVAALVVIFLLMNVAPTGKFTDFAPGEGMLLQDKYGDFSCYTFESGLEESCAVKVDELAMPGEHEEPRKGMPEEHEGPREEMPEGMTGDPCSCFPEEMPEEMPEGMPEGMPGEHEEPREEIPMEGEEGPVEFEEPEPDSVELY